MSLFHCCRRAAGRFLTVAPPHGGHYVWPFRGKEGVDRSYVKDWADLNHPNAVTPPINHFSIGWTSDREWTNHTVDVKEAWTS
jgi:hypothetical protein